MENNHNLPLLMIYRDGSQPSFVNQAFCDILGYTLKELLGIEIQELVHPEDLARNSIKAHMFEDNHSKAFEAALRLRKKDGDYLPMRSYACFHFDEKNNRDMIAVRYQPISDQAFEALLLAHKEVVMYG